MCGESIGHQNKSVIQNPTKQSLETIFSAAEKRQDIFGKKF